MLCNTKRFKINYIINIKLFKKFNIFFLYVLQSIFFTKKNYIILVIFYHKINVKVLITLSGCLIQLIDGMSLRNIHDIPILLFDTV